MQRWVVWDKLNYFFLNDIVSANVSPGFQKKVPIESANKEKTTRSIKTQQTEESQTQIAEPTSVLKESSPSGMQRKMPIESMERELRIQESPTKIPEQKEPCHTCKGASFETN